MEEESKFKLPKEFLEGPWLSAQALMLWLGDHITKELLKSWRARGVIAYSAIGGIILYNKPWILQQLDNGWTWKIQKRKPKK